MQDIDDNDVTSTRVIELENGNKLYLKRTDPYGFLQFNLDKGQLPEFMKGTYTSFFEADRAYRQYLQYRQFENETPAATLTGKDTDKRATK